MERRNQRRFTQLMPRVQENLSHESDIFCVNNLSILCMRNPLCGFVRGQCIKTVRRFSIEVCEDALSLILCMAFRRLPPFSSRKCWDVRGSKVSDPWHHRENAHEGLSAVDVSVCCMQRSLSPHLSLMLRVPVSSRHINLIPPRTRSVPRHVSFSQNHANPHHLTRKNTGPKCANLKRSPMPRHRRFSSTIGFLLFPIATLQKSQIARARVCVRAHVHVPHVSSKWRAARQAVATQLARVRIYARRHPHSCPSQRRYCLRSVIGRRKEVCLLSSSGSGRGDAFPICLGDVEELNFVMRVSFSSHSQWTSF